MGRLNDHAGRTSNYNEYDYHFRRQQSAKMKRNQWEHTPSIHPIWHPFTIFELLGEGTLWVFNWVRRWVEEVRSKET